MSFSIKTSLWNTSKTAKAGYSPRFIKKAVPSRDVVHIATHPPIKETFFADAHRRDAFKKATLNLRRWLSSILLSRLLESRGARWSSGASVGESQTLEALSENISYILCFGHSDIEAVDQTAFVAIYYASFLVPNGILKQQELYTAAGVLVATRLFMVSYALAVKCFNDSYKPTMYKECHRLKANLTGPSAMSLELSAVEALGFDIFLQHGKWAKHLETILEWTTKCSGGIHLSVTDRIARLLDEAKSSMSVDEMIAFQGLNGMVASPRLNAKVREQLVSGLIVEESY